MASITRKRRSRYELLPAWLTRKRVVLAVITAAVIVVGTFGVRVAVGLAHLFHTDPFSAVAGALHGGGGSTIDLAAQNGQRINIMLYGYGGGNHDGAFLSDSIMLVSIQPQPSGPPQVAEISLPRDWYAPIKLANGKTSFGRVNEAYADGMSGQGPVNAGQTGAGASVANPTFEHLLGIGVDHFVGIDFHAFASAVDAVGGVDVTVPNTFTDTQYPHGECGQGDCAYETVHFNAGTQHMDGATALIFARSRHGNGVEGSDFARSRRQQIIIAALKQKVVSLGGIGNLPDVIGALGENVLSNLQVGDAEALYSLVKDVDSSKIEHISIDNTNFLYDCNYPSQCGAYYLYANDSSFTSLHHFIANVFPGQDVIAEKAAVTFFDASGRRAGATARWASVMGMLGFATHDGGSTTKQTVTQVIDESGGKNVQTAKWLASYFGVTVTTQQPAAGASGGTPASTGGVVVVLGSAEEKAFLGNPGTGH
jgi:LCP family protein required for cell wall assembly